jgi:hypothetical protein
MMSGDSIEDRMDRPMPRREKSRVTSHIISYEVAEEFIEPIQIRKLIT